MISTLSQLGFQKSFLQNLKRPQKHDWLKNREDSQHYVEEDPEALFLALYKHINSLKNIYKDSQFHFYKTLYELQYEYIPTYNHCSQVLTSKQKLQYKQLLSILQNTINTLLHKGYPQKTFHTHT